MSEWVLVPGEIVDAMFDAGFDGSDHLESWRNMLAARPPIPRSVWAAMVERGARANKESMFGKNAPIWDDDRAEMNEALRAALGNPRVEGDEA